MVAGEHAQPPASLPAPVTDPAPGGSGPKRDLFLAPLPVADERAQPVPEEPSPEPAGATTVEPARARARGAKLLAGDTDKDIAWGPSDGRSCLTTTARGTSRCADRRVSLRHTAGGQPATSDSSASAPSAVSPTG